MVCICYGLTLYSSVVLSGSLSVYTPLPIAAGSYGRIYPMAHQRVAIVMPMHCGITNNLEGEARCVNEYF